MAKDTRMIDKDPTAFGLITYIWVVVLSVWGGVVSYVRKVNSGALPRFSVSALIGDLFTSGFAGVITFWLTQAAGMNELIGAAMVGISGHMGSKAVDCLESILQRKYTKM